MEIKCVDWNERFIEKPAEKFAKCRAFFDRLAELLAPEYEVMASCNKDLSAYLVPAGTQNQVTYYSKPIGSFRVSDHWNWYSNLTKCSWPNYIQCFSADVPYAKPRDPKYPYMATKGRKAFQVGYFGRDKKYHCVYGEQWNKKLKTWEWVEATPEEVARNLRLIGEEESA